jgi:hypothetical protein|nr:MAG TPA: hypothetical protein [Caudoviricetes sp.]
MDILDLSTDTNRKARKLLGHPLTKREIYLFIYLDACLKDHIEYSEKFMTSYDKDIILSLNYMGLLRAIKTPQGVSLAVKRSLYNLIQDTIFDCLVAEIEEECDESR